MKKCYLISDVQEKEIILHMIQEGIENKIQENYLESLNELKTDSDECVVVLMSYDPDKYKEVRAKLPKAYLIGLLWKFEEEGFDEIYTFPFNSSEIVGRIMEKAK